MVDILNNYPHLDNMESKELDQGVKQLLFYLKRIKNNSIESY